jgi:hypothetical protein
VRTNKDLKLESEKNLSEMRDTGKRDEQKKINFRNKAQFFFVFEFELSFRMSCPRVEIEFEFEFEFEFEDELSSF